MGKGALTVGGPEAIARRGAIRGLDGCDDVRAVAAGLAVGFWESGADLGAALTEDARFEPKMPESDREARLADWRRAVERSFDWAR